MYKINETIVPIYIFVIH